ncbi:predicted protein [Verticillium alfalfae VaMs.102]|uniref:Predicted protein n=1 Tax=Verticillium alfalfae (strain VaMs.102 / ATCC MYA-4576 / FGSC 10136) TaxID=526221 RepID=C9SD70_VERA1|nr:predicted protein [Verticillium alfalfae VaMs.102]EEY17035.1 predicted protein [Verticillium alfalfae VaMs.102]
MSQAQEKVPGRASPIETLDEVLKLWALADKAMSISDATSAPRSPYSDPGYRLRDPDLFADDLATRLARFAVSETIAADPRESVQTVLESTFSPAAGGQRTSVSTQPTPGLTRFNIKPTRGSPPPSPPPGFGFGCSLKRMSRASLDRLLLLPGRQPSRGSGRGGGGGTAVLEMRETIAQGRIRASAKDEGPWQSLHQGGVGRRGNEAPCFRPGEEEEPIRARNVRRVTWK